jgi:hypothetical protein
MLIQSFRHCRGHLRIEAMDHYSGVVTNVQDYIAAGQFRGGEQLVDAQNKCPLTASSPIKRFPSEPERRRPAPIYCKNRRWRTIAPPIERDVAMTNELSDIRDGFAANGLTRQVALSSRR